ncbi:hypothetical protein AB9P05_18655 [Roseivirga sp. BDSF3-8]|uniref:hypothetical protein n=1 Tax=Roseivirga sp. BDSF3-8 TaxID=3241598 RepID=UPI0035325693
MAGAFFWLSGQNLEVGGIKVIVSHNGCFSQYRLGFDKHQLAFLSCDERIKIKDVNVITVDDEGIAYTFECTDCKPLSRLLKMAAV